MDEPGKTDMTHSGAAAAPAEDYLYFDDIEAGLVFKAGPVTVTQEEIIEFAQKYDPQPMHIDPELAKDTVFGELVSSGWLTACLGMRMFLQSVNGPPGGMIGRTIEELQWPRPVRPGDVLTGESTVLERRPSNSRKDIGIVRFEITAKNQNGEVVYLMRSVVIMPRRPA